MIINRGAVEVDYQPRLVEVDSHISRDDVFDYHPLKNVIFILFIIP